MLEITETTTLIADPILRSYIYHLLASGYKYPTLEMFKQFRDGQHLGDLFALICALPYLSTVVEDEINLFAKMYKDLQDLGFQDLEVKYVAAFDVGFPEPPCPAYEGHYADKVSRTETMMEVSAFYKHFGLSMDQEEGKRELPDYISAELEFMHFLAYKEAQAREDCDQELLKGYILAQRDFLERHLTRWLPKFYEKVLSVEDLPFYPDLARITLGFINAEFALVSKLMEEEAGQIK
jgi:DMSO reductase family type II enzyme chaperone